jgi:putative membrane protein
MKIIFAVLISVALTGAAIATTKDAEEADAAMAVMHMGKATFVKSVGGASAFEIESSKLAVQKATSSDVKEFAQKMIDDHTKAGEKLSAILKTEGDAPPLMKLAPKQADAMKLLSVASGADFEATYIALQANAHMEAVALFRTYAGKPDDDKVGGFAKETLPTLEMHLEHVKMLLAAR